MMVTLQRQHPGCRMCHTRKNEDLINIGAYVKGSDPACDEAIRRMNSINEFLCQSTADKFEYENIIADLIKLAK